MMLMMMMMTMTMTMTMMMLMMMTMMLMMMMMIDDSFQASMPYLQQRKPKIVNKEQYGLSEKAGGQEKWPCRRFALDAGEHLSCGTEDVDPGSEVPWHEHAANEEMLYCTGRGCMDIETLSAIVRPPENPPCKNDARGSNGKHGWRILEFFHI
eukprot:2393415-Amphidinium_carterae.1